MLRKKTAESHSTRRFKKSVEWSFPKASRFKPTKRGPAPEYRDLPSTLGDRACSFGMGKRWTPINLKGKDAPSPGAYEAHSEFGKQNKGPSFKRRYKRMLKMQEDSPGPGSYNPYSPIGKNGPKFTFRQRIMKIVRTSTPPPNTYRPSFKLLEKSSFQNISFGIGERPKIYGKMEEMPGPGAYDIPGGFRMSQSRGSSPMLSNRAKTPI
jgi:hypothetical protein